ncbi:MAG: hypothetical protein GY841_00015 [FCB group bacterium]|nr:hypothetical protein [FCB group bacterium]
MITQSKNSAYHIARDFIESLPNESKFTKKSLINYLLKQEQLFSVKLSRTAAGNAITFLRRHGVVQSNGQKTPVYMKISNKPLNKRKKLLTQEEKLFALSPMEIGRSILTLLKQKQSKINSLKNTIQELQEDYDSMSDKCTDAQRVLMEYKERMINMGGR